MDNIDKKFLFISVFLVALMLFLSVVAQNTMEKECSEKHGTFVKAADPINSMCIIPSK